MDTCSPDTVLTTATLSVLIRAVYMDNNTAAGLIQADMQAVALCIG